MTIRGAKGRPGDVACKVCQRPLLLNQAWKQRRGKWIDYFCAEHVVITDNGRNWRPLGDGEKPPELVMGEPTPAERYVDEPAPMMSVAELAAESLEHGIPYDADVTGGPHYHAIEREPLPMDEGTIDDLVEKVREAAAPSEDFDPINDVGF